MKIEIIDVKFAKIFIQEKHYSPVMPKITKLCLGWFRDKDETFLGDELCGVITLGWGTRPSHTIKKIFPSATTESYLEIGKFCMSEGMPPNSESEFISQSIKWIKTMRGTRAGRKHLIAPECEYIFSWSDGAMGKPGYVYQASNFLYGGHIWTDFYVSADGEKIHPRSIGNHVKKSRPNDDERRELKLDHIRGKQFRYIYPLSKSARRKLKQSTFDWNTEHPKDVDLEWKYKAWDKTKFVLTKTMPFQHNPNAIEYNEKSVNRGSQMGAATLADFME